MFFPSQIGTYNKDGQLTLQKLPKENFEQGNILKINRTLRVVTIVVRDQVYHEIFLSLYHETLNR